MESDSSSSLYQDSFFQEALKKYEEIKEKNKVYYFDSDQLISIAKYYTSLEQHNDAHDAIDYALSIHPTSTPLLVIKAHHLIELKKIEEAKMIAYSITENYEKDVKLLKAELFIIEDNLKESDLILIEIINEEEDKYDNLLDVASLYLDYDLTNKALPLFEKAAQIDSSDEYVRTNLVRCYLACDLLDKAVEFYNKLLDIDPYSTQYWFELGRTYTDAEEYNKGIEACEFALTTNDSHEPSITTIGGCYFNLENFQEACKYFEKSDLLVPNIKRNIAYIAFCYFNTNEYKTAIKKFKIAAETPSDTDSNKELEIYLHLAISYNELGRYDKSIIYINKAIKEDPLNALLYFNKGQIYVYKNNIKKALYCFNKAIELDKGNTRIPMKVGCVFYYLGDYEKALEYFLLVNRLDPDFKSVYLILAFTYEALDKPDEFNYYFTKATNQDPSSVFGSLKHLTDPNNGLTDAIYDFMNSVGLKSDDLGIDDFIL